MVSLRRRRLLGLCSGKSSFVAPLPKNSENGNAPENSTQNVRPVSLRPSSSDNVCQPHGRAVEKGPASLNVYGASSPEEQSNQPKEQHVEIEQQFPSFSEERVFSGFPALDVSPVGEGIPLLGPPSEADVVDLSLREEEGENRRSKPMTSENSPIVDEGEVLALVPTQGVNAGPANFQGEDVDCFSSSASGLPIKRRKRHRRKQIQNQEPCLMRGVYFKNMKWQAAIKVDKKQIHLGTVGSQEEAARLYDRAAFMCGREPNFELSEEEKQELRQFKWDEFLAFTRRSITHKKYKRRVGLGPNKRSESPLEEDGDWDSKKGINGFLASEEAALDSSAS